MREHLASTERIQSGRGLPHSKTFGFTDVSIIAERHGVRQSSAALALLLLFATPLAHAEDWPQFLGPHRNGESASAITLNWPKEGPAVVWQMKMGEGFSTPVVADAKLVVFHRVESKEHLDCLDARTGKPIWHYEYSTDYQDDFGRGNGPRATPTWDDGRIYALGATGD